MNHHVFILQGLTVVTLLMSFVSSAQTWTHKGKPAQLIELYTSEGCSSCPPADHFLSKFQTSDKLWEAIIPLAFHVDYWDYLGWKDEFAHPSYSQRQRLYRAYGAINSVYTPGFVVDGQEWRGFFSRSPLPSMAMEERGSLTLAKQQNTFSLTYNRQGKYTAHLVLLGMDEKTQVKAGENRGRELEHDFVVLNKYQLNSENRWDFQNIIASNQADAVAVWLTQGNQSEPIQTVAGYIQK